MVWQAAGAATQSPAASQQAALAGGGAAVAGDLHPRHAVPLVGIVVHQLCALRDVPAVGDIDLPRTWLCEGDGAEVQGRLGRRPTCMQGKTGSHGSWPAHAAIHSGSAALADAN